MNEATKLLESDCNDRTAFGKLLDELAASPEELRKINAELEGVIPVEDLEREYASAAHYDDQTLETLTRLRGRLEDLSVSCKVQSSFLDDAQYATCPNDRCVLLRFRWYLVPITADIEKALLQVEIRKEDRDLFRFLWFDKSPTVPFKEEVVEVWCMTRVPFGSKQVHSCLRLLYIIT
ncbi:hypothetical protein HPB49_007178 [Dermacentor silvarum]|uniref:Uncharacterized protein n=1 Tax=Dermacentor silvarum TaxID=543639 RepID=A0ACB8CJL5_DERSI|nr:hypothetical protein HPB49_007178 [Dermacentor silvarum]